MACVELLDKLSAGRSLNNDAAAEENEAVVYRQFFADGPILANTQRCLIARRPETL